jgi:hypothetical protein
VAAQSAAPPGRKDAVTHSKLISCLTTAAIALAIALPVAKGQNPPQPAPQQPVNVISSDPSLQKIASKCIPFNASVTVSGQASVEAVLIPPSLVRRIFGTEVANNYAVVELVVSNKDSKAALIVQSVFLDYSQWLLSGLSELPPAPKSEEETQKPNKPWQVASVESRLIRGQLLDAQQWTSRNWTIRVLTAIGSVAAGFQFPFSGDVARGIAAFNGEVVPGISTLWPDGTVNQINRISDFGFQTNKIIPKEASDIVVAFFPIDRFLTPGFHKMFVANPSGFFMPAELINDPKTSRTMTKVILPMAKAIDETIGSHGTKEGQATDKNDLKADENDLRQRMGRSLLKNCQNAPEDDKDCNLQKLFSRLSLNSVRVVVGGVMSINAATVPATVYSVDFKDGNNGCGVWATPGKAHQVTMTGVYLGGGTPSVVDANGAPIDGITLKADSGASSDTKLVFTMTLSKCLSGTTVYFKVTKAPDGSQPADGSSNASEQPANAIPSMPYQVAIPNCDCSNVAAPSGSANK